MASLMKFMVLGAILALFGTQAQAVQEMCGELKEHLNGLEDGDEIFARAKEYIMAHASPGSKERSLITAWDNIYHFEGCSTSAWMDLVYLGMCQYMIQVKALEQPIKSYTEKCINPEIVRNVVEKQMSYEPTRKDLVDARFVDKFYQDNPKDHRLYVFFIEGGGPETEEALDCCRANKSSGAVVDAIERDFAKQGRDPKAEFKSNPTAVAKYLDEKLYKPCEGVAQHYEPLAIQVAIVGMHYETGQLGLIRSFDLESRNTLFRYKLCQISEEDKEVLNKSVKQQYV